jgi:hypothetical protein
VLGLGWGRAAFPSPSPAFAGGGGGEAKRPASPPPGHAHTAPTRARPRPQGANYLARAWACVILFCLANLLKVVAAKVISRTFYTNSHYKKAQVGCLTA